MATRIISSVIGILIGVVVLFLSDTPVLNVVLAVFAVIGIYELYKANKCLEYKAISVLAFFYGASSPFICMLENQIYEKVFTTATIIGLFACYFFVHKKMSIEKILLRALMLNFYVSWFGIYCATIEFVIAVVRSFAFLPSLPVEIKFD